MSHPARCVGCRGSSWTDGPPIIETIDGRPHRYTTVTECTHPWWQDDTGWDPHYDEPLHADHPRAARAHTAGYLQAQHELWELSGGTLSTPRPERKDIA